MDPKIETSVVVFDFILNEAEIEEKKIFGEKTMKKSLKQKKCFSRENRYQRIAGGGENNRHDSAQA